MARRRSKRSANVSKGRGPAISRARLRVTAAATTDLEEIWAYIAQESSVSADRFVDELLDKFPLLAERPEIGVARETLAPGPRLFPVRRYLIFYRWTPPYLDIVRVLHSSRDIGPDDFAQRSKPDN